MVSPKISTFCQRLYHKKCQLRWIGGQKSQNLVNVVCEQPLIIEMRKSSQKLPQHKTIVVLAIFKGGLLNFILWWSFLAWLTIDSRQYHLARTIYVEFISKWYRVDLEVIYFTPSGFWLNLKYLSRIRTFAMKKSIRWLSKLHFSKSHISRLKHFRIGLELIEVHLRHWV